jgi:hypothetical protein
MLDIAVALTRNCAQGLLIGATTLPYGQQATAAWSEWRLSQVGEHHKFGVARLDSTVTVKHLN